MGFPLPLKMKNFLNIFVSTTTNIDEYCNLVITTVAEAPSVCTSLFLWLVNFIFLWHKDFCHWFSRDRLILQFLRDDNFYGKNRWLLSLFYRHACTTCCHEVSAPTAQLEITHFYYMGFHVGMQEWMNGNTDVCEWLFLHQEEPDKSWFFFSWEWFVCQHNICSL